jgi:peptide/nickel transport system ATP-binding protein
MTLIIVSHDAGVVGHLCDRAVRMGVGRTGSVLERADLQILKS